MIVDGHAHLGLGREKQLTPHQLIEQMDRYGVNLAVVCPVDEYIVLHNREGNDYILEAVREHPDRLIGFAVANPWYGSQAVEELRRAISEGLRGLKLKSSIQGFSISDEIVYPLIEAATKLHIPIYCHTGTPIFAMPFQLAHLAARYPEVDFIMGHSGASDFWNDVPPVLEMCPNIYVETSKIPPSTIFLLLSHNLTWAERIIFGSNIPVSSYGIELGKINDVVSDREVRAKILGVNMLRLLGGKVNDH